MKRIFTKPEKMRNPDRENGGKTNEKNFHKA